MQSIIKINLAIELTEAFTVAGLWDESVFSGFKGLELKKAEYWLYYRGAENL